MSSFMRSFLKSAGVLGVVLGTVYFISTTNIVTSPQEQASAVITASPSYEESQGTTSPLSTTAPAESREIGVESLSDIKGQSPLPPETIDFRTRLALVNILCSTPRDAAAVSGSGVLIDPRGIVLTNAHVAQYVLLANHSDVAISCTIRTGSPAQGSWDPKILFFPSLWLASHVKDIVQTNPPGTGEHDYALLYISPPTDTQTSSAFPYLEQDVKYGRVEEKVIVAAYPAESESETVLTSLYATTVPMDIKKMLTFTDQLIDVFSLGGTTIAQGGSSGGAVVNDQGHLVGIVTTTSAGTSPEARDLRAITLAHIERSVRAHTNVGLEAFLQSDPIVVAEAFKPHAEQFAAMLVTELSKQQ